MRKKKAILWISPYAPYDKVAHAGGKSHNFYIKYFQKSGQFDITLLSLCLKKEKVYLDLNKYGISNSIFVMDETIREKLIRLMISGLAFRNPFDPFGAICLPYERYQMMRLIKSYRKTKKRPDIVILQWTFSLMLIDTIKKTFPESRIVVIEEDVTFLNYYRRRNSAKGIFREFFWKTRFAIMKKVELDKLKIADLVITNNPKDTQLLLDNNMKESVLFTAAPYIDDYSGIERKQEGKDIIFFGAMSRAENYLSAIWFIEKVLPLLDDSEVRFVIIGSNPDTSLYRYESSRVVITGFVEDMSDIFSKCMCLVAPLVGGAGIKIKILEAMSAGIPVLTNSIGIEGIGATDKVDYFYCDKPEEYAFYINDMSKGKLKVDDISINAKNFILNNYDLPKKLDSMIRRILL